MANLIRDHDLDGGLWLVGTTDGLRTPQASA